MIYVGIDVAKDKHDCFIMGTGGEVLHDVFVVSNNMDGFNNIFQKIQAASESFENVKVGLEATGHYSYNLLGFLIDKGLDPFVINPLHSTLFRKSLSLRKTKTDKVDARTIAAMLASDLDFKPYTDTAYHNEELKSLVRYRLFQSSKSRQYFLKSQKDIFYKQFTPRHCERTKQSKPFLSPSLRDPDTPPMRPRAKFYLAFSSLKFHIDKTYCHSVRTQ